MRNLLLLPSLLFLVNCSAIYVKDRSAAPKTKDVYFSARRGNELRKRVTILPFVNQSAYKSAAFTDEARDWFIQELNKTDQTVLLDWQALGLRDIEKYYDPKEGYKTADIVKKIRASGAHAIVIGTIKDLRTGKRGDSVGLFRRVKAEIKAVVELQVVSVRSGQVLVAETREADMSESSTRIAERVFASTDLSDNPEAVKFVVQTAFEKTLPILLASLDKFSWEGRVALVKGERIYLNAGRQSGLQVGDVLRIVENQEEVYDPETQKFIGHIKGRMKGTVEVMSYFGDDGAVTNIHSGSGFKENDLVEFY